jgi:hypothetical protein
VIGSRARAAALLHKSKVQVNFKFLKLSKVIDKHEKRKTGSAAAESGARRFRFRSAGFRQPRVGGRSAGRGDAS